VALFDPLSLLKHYTTNFIRKRRPLHSTIGSDAPHVHAHHGLGALHGALRPLPLLKHYSTNFIRKRRPLHSSISSVAAYMHARPHDAVRTQPEVRCSCGAVAQDALIGVRRFNGAQCAAAYVLTMLP
jgi:hypothetical protein